MAQISLSGVNKIYPNGTHAVHDVDLHIADGEFMIMVGPSGCAKSTILRMIAGLETPTTGTIDIGGRVVNDVAPKDRDIAMVFQSYALYPHMTVRENMAFGLRLRKMPETEIAQRVAEAARILGLEDLLDRLPKEMSGGQRQRVAMGRAIVREPQAFLMDEPLSNLDAKLRVQMRTEIAKLHQRLQTTTVYVTHDQVEAMTLGQRICILRKGIVQQVDSPRMVYANPANIFVGGFIGSPGMNFMMGTLVRHDGAPCMAIGPTLFPLPESVSQRLLIAPTEAGTPVVVGMRPEHVTPVAPGHASALVATVDLIETLGSEAYAYLRLDVPVPDLSSLSDTQASSSSFVARIAPHEAAPTGEAMHLVPQLEHIHIFDPATQLTLLSPAPAIELVSPLLVTSPIEQSPDFTMPMQMPAHYAPEPVYQVAQQTMMVPAHAVLEHDAGQPSAPAPTHFTWNHDVPTYDSAQEPLAFPDRTSSPATPEPNPFRMGISPSPSAPQGASHDPGLQRSRPTSQPAPSVPRPGFAPHRDAIPSSVRPPAPLTPAPRQHQPDPQRSGLQLPPLGAGTRSSLFQHRPLFGSNNPTPN